MKTWGMVLRTLCDEVYWGGGAKRTHSYMLFVVKEGPKSYNFGGHFYMQLWVMPVSSMIKALLMASTSSKLWGKEKSNIGQDQMNRESVPIQLCFSRPGTDDIQHIQSRYFHIYPNLR